VLNGIIINPTTDTTIVVKTFGFLIPMTCAYGPIRVIDWIYGNV